MRSNSQVLSDWLETLVLKISQWHERRRQWRSLARKERRARIRRKPMLNYCQGPRCEQVIQDGRLLCKPCSVDFLNWLNVDFQDGKDLQARWKGIRMPEEAPTAGYDDWEPDL